MLLAVPPPPPKQFTDEELKQQYGIHLATRLQTDENGKESKWADIDDDEDDWAPETVVWMDGTKSTLTPQDAAAQLEKEQKPASPQPQKAAEGVKAILAAKKPTELGPTKTILKPGANAAAIQAKQSGLAAGSTADKSSLKSMSPVPAPTKSPWAALPPVDKISPINPPVQQQAHPPPFMSQDARAYEQPQAASTPAREIAADTFDRSWREGEGGTRELFNAANGRYEAAPEGRRTSIKPDSSFRKPAVLQRPSQSGASPAEPSPAFQSRTTSQADGSWGRRRGSSVSQGSIPPARRMSVTKVSDPSPASERRNSTVIGHDLRSSPRVARNEPGQPVFAQQSAWQQQMPPRPDSGAQEEQEDPVKVQERVMREKRELAKKRKEEEEQRLEAEKKERLKARLASLEGAGKSRKERDAEAAAAAPALTPSSEKPAEASLHVPAASPEASWAQPAKPAEAAAMAAPALEAQSLPPAPGNLLPEQHSLEEAVPSPLPPKPPVASLPERPISSADQNQRQQARSHLSPRTNARAPFQQQASAYRQPASSLSSPGERKQQPFIGRSPLPNNDAFSTPWPKTAPNGNVWGTSGIGNGTFESANVFAPMPMSQQSSALPPPPGMGSAARASNSTRISPQSLAQESRSPNMQQQSLAEQPRGPFAPPGLEARPDAFANQSRVNGASPAPGLSRPAHGPGPIGPPSRAQQPQPQRANPLDAWNNAAQRLPNQYKNEAAAAAQRGLEVTGPAPARDDTIKETFKQTSTDQTRLGGPRRYDKTEYMIHDAQGSRSVQSLSPAPPNAQTQPSGPFSTSSPLQQNPWKSAAENMVRIPDGSLNPAHGGSSVQQPPIAPPTTQQPQSTSNQGQVNFPTGPLAAAPVTKDQSPPPPETSSHPAYGGDSGHPLVKLPQGKPVVKLPPAMQTSSQSLAPHQNTVMMPQRPLSNWGAPSSSKPIVMQPDWQARFNGLFNRLPIQTETPPSPPKTPPKMMGPALAVTASSRTVMDQAPTATSATVSLPRRKQRTTREGFTIDQSSDVRSKPTMEQMFAEELSFGSKPIVNVPRRPVYSQSTRYNRPQYNMITGVESKVAPRSIEGMDLLEIHPRRNNGIYAHLPGTKLIRRLVTHASNGPRTVSGKFNRDRASRGNTPASPIMNGTPNHSSRKTSVQKGPTPAPASPATASSPATAEGAKKGSSTWTRPPKGNNNHRKTSAKQSV